MVKVIPFAPMPLPVLKSISAPFQRLGGSAAKMVPNLEHNLEQAELGLEAKEYGAVIVLLTVFYTVFFAALGILLLSKMTDNFIPMGVLLGLVMGMLMFVQITMYPSILARKKVKSVEKNLVFGLRAILIQLKSGVSLFDSMSMVAHGDYGTVSEEFKKAVDEINTGTPEQEALQEMSERNPSPYLRKALWQIVNGMNAGADISAVLSETVSSMIREQRLAINKYGSQLRVLSLMYMMIGVIMPALGVTLLIVLFTFPMVGDALAKMPILNDTGDIIQGLLPGETYTVGDTITGLEGKKRYSGQMLGIKVAEIEGQRAVFMLVNEEGKTQETQAVFASGTNLRDQFAASDGAQSFGESLRIKSIGTNLFGQEQVEITRFEPIHLIFWGFMGMVAVMQFMYIGFIKSRRPSIIG